MLALWRAVLPAVGRKRVAEVRIRWRRIKAMEAVREDDFERTEEM